MLFSSSRTDVETGRPDSADYRYERKFVCP